MGTDGHLGGVKALVEGGGSDVNAMGEGEHEGEDALYPGCIARVGAIVITQISSSIWWMLMRERERGWTRIKVYGCRHSPFPLPLKG